MKTIELTRHNKAEHGTALGCINNHKCLHDFPYS